MISFSAASRDVEREVQSSSPVIQGLDLSVRSHFFTERVARHWHRPPRGVNVTRWSAFKRCSDTDLHNMLYSGCRPLPTAAMLGQQVRQPKSLLFLAISHPPVTSRVAEEMLSWAST